jgi:hypothetical protein
MVWFHPGVHETPSHGDLLKVSRDALSGKCRSTGTQTYIYWETNEKPPKGLHVPLEVLYWHLPITPFHGGLQKVKG